MRKPTHQTAFSRLLAHILCYLVSANNDIKYLSKDEWNPYWCAKAGLEVTSLTLYPLFQFTPLVLTNDQKRPMYESIQIYSHREQESVLNEEGDLNNESDDSDFEMELMRKSWHQESIGSHTSISARHSSPMLVE